MNKHLYVKIVYPLCLFIAAILFAFLQNFSRELYSYGIGGLFVPDSISLRDTLLVYAGENFEIPYENLTTLYLVMIFYFPAAKFGAWVYVIINVVILSLSLIIYNKSLAFFSEDASLKNKLLIIASLVTLLNPYIISIIGYPSKEILLILMTNLFIYYALRRSGMYPLFIISLSVYFIRDGYGLILFLLSLSIFILKFFQNKRKYFWFSSLVFIIYVSIDPTLFGGVNRAIERNLMLAESYDVYQEYSFFLKIFGNIINLGLRPQFFDVNGSFYIINIGFWVLGICVLSGFIWSIFNIRNNGHSKAFMSFVIIFITLSVSYGSFIQPRYLMPLMMWLAIGLGGYLKWPSLFLCLFAPIFFYFIDFLPELQEGVFFD